jgi:hypothetical protein
MITLRKGIGGQDRRGPRCLRHTPSIRWRARAHRSQEGGQHAHSERKADSTRTQAGRTNTQGSGATQAGRVKQERQEEHMCSSGVRGERSRGQAGLGPKKLTAWHQIRTCAHVHLLASIVFMARRKQGHKRCAASWRGKAPSSPALTARPWPAEISTRHTAKHEAVHGPASSSFFHCFSKIAVQLQGCLGHYDASSPHTCGGLCTLVKEC